MLDLPNIKIIGVTGMSGAGKSTVCREISKYCGTVIDCDKVAREIAAKRDFLDELKERFGMEVLNPDGTLNRVETARIIFSDNEKKELYNRIIFKYIVYEVIQRIRAAKGMVLVDAPTLFEAGLDMVCTKIVSVIADFDVCAKRISERDNISFERAKARLISQHDAEFFKSHSNPTIENNGTQQELIHRAKVLAFEIMVNNDTI
ncbi:MAG: dephospho-CoA kinase [Oscillospiraceae bacterium]